LWRMKRGAYPYNCSAGKTGILADIEIKKRKRIYIQKKKEGPKPNMSWVTEGTSQS